MPEHPDGKIELPHAASISSCPVEPNSDIESYLPDLHFFFRFSGPWTGPSCPISCRRNPKRRAKESNSFQLCPFELLPGHPMRFRKPHFIIPRLELSTKKEALGILT